MSSEQYLEVGEDIIYQPVDQELVLLDLKSQAYYGLDSMGARIWQLLVEYGSISAVVGRICEEYDGEKNRVLRDVESMVQDFLAAGLLKQTNQKL